ncbi:MULTISPECIES: hypothetical protein [Streptomyces rochei group]|uniref:hypothetical protein n=1 Tax=Streptomyces rochei group TaxID=2867164 RepID=UPI0018757F29|nr:hypothetical protein [Streptomyces vinaceusdrappus]GHC36866.1 hypothetical protein GCM10010308_64200 [Streptomyces vinaceusdrappus]
MAMDDRARREVKALLEVGKEFCAQAQDTPAGLFLSGMLSGLAMAVHINEGSTAEKEMENLDTQLAAAVGRAFLTGQIKQDGD